MGDECAILVDLKHHHHLISSANQPVVYDSDYDDLDYEDDSTFRGPSDPTKYHIYPQAFSPRYGNIQINDGGFSFFADFPNIIQRMVQTNSGLVIEDMIVTITCAQLYGEAAHKIRGQSGKMSVQRAGVAAALAGETCAKTHAASKHSHLVSNLKTRLPHEHMQLTVSNTDRNFGLRNEAYCVVDLDLLPDDYRNGR